MNLFTPDSVSKAAEKICFKDFFHPSPFLGGGPVFCGRVLKVSGSNLTFDFDF